MKGKNVLFFDLDDTLVIETASAESCLLEAAKMAFEKYGTDPDALQKAVRTRARELWHSLPTIDYAKRIGVSSWEGLWADLTGPEENTELAEMRRNAPLYRFRSWSNALKDFSVFDDVLALEMSEKFQADRHQRHYVYPESVGVLETCSKDYRLGMITNGAPGIQWEKIGRSGIRGYFEHIIVSGDVGIGKPDRKIFEIAMDKFGIGPGDCLMIGDSLRSDIAGSRNAGIRCVRVDRSQVSAEKFTVGPDKEMPRTVEPDYTVHDLNELLPILPAVFR